MSEWISPDEMIRRAKEVMLDGHEPSSEHDWILVLNCIALNVSIEIAEPVTVLMAAMYDMPVTEEDARNIARFQIAQKTGQSLN